MGQSIWSHTFDNGLVLVAESMPWLESAAFSLILPAGCTRDPESRLGLANFTCEMVQRGCGKLNSREFIETLDRWGADRTASVSQSHTSFGAAMLADNLTKTLAIYADVVRRPHIPADQLEDGRLVCFQELNAVEDDLAQMVMLSARRQTYPAPWGRRGQGEMSHVEQISIDDICKFHKSHYSPQGTILSVAGKIDWPRLRDEVAQLFGDWHAKPQDELVETPSTNKYEHIQHDSSQTQIAVAYPTVPYGDPSYFVARGAVGVLSDGMSSRLFTQVRELRGLCYAVYASYHSLLNQARVFCYSGTSTDRAQETLDVIVQELIRLAKGIDEPELLRLKARVKSSLIMQQESSPARSGSMAGDWYHLGRIRTLDEIEQVFDSLTTGGINKYLAEHPPSDFLVATLGEQPLELPFAVS